MRCRLVFQVGISKGLYMILSKRKIKNNIFCYLFIFPTLAGFIIFTIYPLMSSFVYSFHRYTFKDYYFVGLKNYIHLLGDPIFIKSLLVAFYFVIGCTPATIVLTVIISSLIAKMSQRGKTFFMSVFFLPNITSIVTLTLVWRWIYDYNYGLANRVIASFGYEHINWLSNKYTILPALFIFTVSLSLGMPIILCVAAMLSIPKDYYDAAKIDGASEWQMLWLITVPLIRPIMLFLTITGVIGNFQAFMVIVLMTGGGPFYRTTTIAYLIAKEAFEYYRFGSASAMGIILLLVIAFFTVMQYKYFSKDIQY